MESWTEKVEAVVTASLGGLLFVGLVLSLFARH